MTSRVKFLFLFFTFIRILVVLCPVCSSAGRSAHCSCPVRSDAGCLAGLSCPVSRAAEGLEGASEPLGGYL